MLDKCRTRPVIWITGPPGSGKTALVSSYLDVHKLPCLWYQVDQGDADIASFFYYMGLAAQKAVPRKRSSLPLLTSEYLQGIPTFTRRYFEKLFSWLLDARPKRRKGHSGRWSPETKNRSFPALRASVSPTRFIMVFDNYQEVTQNSPLHEAICEGLSQVPAGANIILISRENPPDDFARLKVKRLIEIIGWKELRFSFDELKDMVRLWGYKSMPLKVLKQLYERTDGWAAGIVLLMEGIKLKVDKPISPEVPMSEDLFHYFAKEVFNRADPEVQDFLLKTSFLPQMSSEMARTLTGSQQSQEILSDLTEKNYFTQKHESRMPLYQFHPLFREFLQAMAKKAFRSEDLSRIKKEAAAILEENGQIENAMQLLAEAGEWEPAIRLILEHASILAGQGRCQTLEGWISALPEPTVQSNPWLLHWMGICRLHFSPPQSRDLFEKAFNTFRKQRDIVGTFFSLSGLFESIIFSLDDFKPFDRTIVLLDEILQEFGGFPSAEIEARLAANMLYAMALRQPSNPKIETWTERVASLSEKTPDINVKAFAIQTLLFCYLFPGELSKAETVLHVCRDLARSPNVTPLFLIGFKDLDAFYCWLTASFEENRRAVKEGLDLSSSTGIPLVDVYLLGHGAAGALSSSDLAGAKVFLKEMASHLERAGSWAKAFYYTLSTWASLIEGNLSKALSHSELGSKFATEAGQPQTQVYPDIATAIILHELKRYREAERYILKSRNLARSARVPLAEFMCFLIQARFAFAKGKDRSGMIYLTKALSLGEEKGYVNTYFWQSAVMADLCKRALEAGIEVRYVQSLIRKRGLMTDPLPYECEEWPWPLRINTLGRFELMKAGEPVQFSVRAPRKVLSLLKVLIAFGRNGASEGHLADALWPDADGDTAQKAFEITIHRLRQLSGNEKVIQVREGHVRLDPRYYMVDAHAFEELLERAETAQSLELIEKALALYKGPFLIGDPGEPWAVSYREQLRSKFLRSVRKLGSHLEKNEQIEKAIEYYQKALEVDSLAEDLYQLLMACYVSRGRKAEALEVYDRCRRTFQSVLGIEPSAKTRAIYAAIRQNKRNDDTQNR